jgi:hypothetical protein
MNKTIRVVTDTATLAVFDAQARVKHLDDGRDWWDVPLHELPQVAGGEVAIASLGSDGVYRVRVTDGDLTGAERAYAAEVVRGLGVRTTSGTVTVAGGEALVGPDGPVAAVHDDRMTVALAPGAYHVDAYLIDWSDSPRWWPDGGGEKDDPPHDIVLTLRARTLPLAPLDREPRLGRSVARSWVFPDEPREIGPVPGMLLTSTVRKAPNGLTLKECGPGGYAATLVDYSPVEWKDRVRFRVTRVDHLAQTLVGEFVEKLDERRRETE